ncbi:3-oxoadipate enol-lactonase [Rhodobacteraceae bacterium XHP0102]|nr:3-oxoadipate enol-lactonase [Rhodobacteraceae bacterium XHP0102]
MSAKDKTCLYIPINGVRHYVERYGPSDAPALVLCHGLGCSTRLWDHVIPHLPDGLQVIAYDQRGHGQSDVPDGPYAMGMLIRDAESLLDALGLKDTMFLGLSLGGMVAQGLAAKRLDLIRALILSNTATKIGTREMWQARIATIAKGGMAAAAPALMERWFTRAFRAKGGHAAFEEALKSVSLTGYLAGAEAISGSDFYTTTAALRLPTLVIAGAEDGSTPPDLMREMADLIHGARFELMRNAGHLPPIEAPEDYAKLIADFIAATGHLSPQLDK